jgi:hypothetical protein
MWEAMKNALMSVKEATGIEIPGLPVDLGSIGDSAATAVQSATGVFDGVATAAEAATGGLADVAEVAATTVDSASQAIPDLTGGPLGGSPEK